MAYSLTDFVKNLKEKGLVYALKEDFQNSKLLKVIMPFLLATSLYALPPETTEYYPNGQIKKKFYYAGKYKNTCVTEVYDQRGNMVEYVKDVWCNGPSKSDFCKKCNYVYNDNKKEIRIECTEDEGCDGKKESHSNSIEVKKEIRKSRELLERQRKMADQLDEILRWREGVVLMSDLDHSHGEELGVVPCNSSEEWWCPGGMDVSEFNCQGDICSKIEVVEIKYSYNSHKDHSKYWAKKIFDKEGNLIEFHDSDGRWYKYHYDNQGRPESLIEKGYCESYWWNKNDELIGYARDMGCDGIKGDRYSREEEEDYPLLCDKNDVWGLYSYRCTLEFKEEYKRIHNVPLPNYDLKIIQYTYDLRAKDKTYEMSVYKCPKNIDCTLNNLDDCRKKCKSMPDEFINELLNEIKLPEYKPPLIQQQHKQNIKQQSKAKGKAKLTKKGKKSGKKRRK